MTTTAGAHAFVPEAYLEGLALETFLLETLLKRHRCSHGRTLYFRRMEMVLKKLLLPAGPSGKRPLLVVDAVRRLQALHAEADRCFREQTLAAASRKRKGRHSKADERWDQGSLLAEKRRAAQGALSELVRVWTGTLPEVLSRIKHASGALFKEASRGFFLPFVTVALAALARIRAFCAEIGARGLARLQELDPAPISTPTSNPKSSAAPNVPIAAYRRCMDLFVEPGGGDRERQRRAMLRSAGGDPGGRAAFASSDTVATLKSLGLSPPGSAAASARKTASEGDGGKAALSGKAGGGGHGEEGAETPWKPSPLAEDKDDGEHEHDDDDYHTLAAAPALADDSTGDGSVGGDDHPSTRPGTGRNRSAGAGTHPDDALDRNLSLVDRFRTKKKGGPVGDRGASASAEQPSPKKRAADRPGGESRGKKKRTSKQPSKKRKKKKEKGGDFFDDIFG
ncbi:unnamed protein product [Pseudo-nitzschia multistriata]|uniref:Uncharacterized protein n=1 Tax=Pseudo-nitzschia multistriata TaxID=183589 RepID=A0A448YWQ1_9STRA|nr:unnamed protein product [Pseudo-nitzschia multistriata]